MIIHTLALLPMALAWLMVYGLARWLAMNRQIDDDRRLSFILTCVSWGAIISGITELLSPGRQLTAPVALLTWVGLDVALGCVWLRLAGGGKPVIDSIRGELRHVRSLIRASVAWPAPHRLMLAVIVLFSVLLGAIALLTPSTNWDSLTYHLPRVMHWIQNRSVEHYPTGCISQLQMGPWAAFVQTHLMLFWGTDRFANLVQWFAMIGCISAATLIAQYLRPAG